MFKRLFKQKKGFTLVEIVVALGLVILLGGFTVTAMTVIPQTKMRQTAQSIKSEFELTRNFAKTHGGQAEYMLTKTEEGLTITRTGENLMEEVTEIQDRNLELFYKLTDDSMEYQLGTTDPADIAADNTIRMTFSQTEGAIIGPHMVDYIIISNGSKNYKFFIKQVTGMMYYDYELEEDQFMENTLNEDITIVKLPRFVWKGEFVDSVALTFDGASQQPDISYDARHIKISGVYRAIDPGTYKITFSLKDPYSSQWVTNSTDDIVLTWKIQN